MNKFIPLFLLLGGAFIYLAYYIVFHQVGMAKIGTVTTPADFWLGMWQGAIVYLTFVASWFDHSIVLYQVQNTGLMYNIGFLLGLAISVGGPSRAKKNKGPNKPIEMSTAKEGAQNS